MTIENTTLRPGLIVVLKTSVRGNVRYFKTDIADDQPVTTEQSEVASTEDRAVWKTERIISDRAEHEAAGKARTKAGGMIRRVCAQTAFGLLCPEADEEVLKKTVEEARAVVAEFNATAKVSQLNLYVMTGRVSPDEVEAVRAIKSEIRDLMEAMEGGVGEGDAKAIRDAATKAKSLAAMLQPDSAARVQIAVDVARQTATRINKDGPGGGLDAAAIRKIKEQRTAFLDFDDTDAVAAPTTKTASLDILPSGAEAPKQRVRADIEG